jgi:SAM-dependent methyltransferase
MGTRRFVDFSNCIACGQPVKEPWLKSCEDLYLCTAHIVDYGVCQGCRLVQQVPIPKDTQAFYTDTYPMHHARARFFDLARRLLIRGVYFEPPCAADRSVLLDFGCGDGSYLQSIRGKVGLRIGFETSPSRAEQVRRQSGCEVYSSQSEAGDALERRVDIVTAHFVLEHLQDLHGTFRFWNRILKPGGIVHLSVPNVRSWEARMFGKKWHGLDAPRHISFPDGESLARLADSHGFRITGQGYGIFPNTWAASLATILAGRYQQGLFLAFIPISFVLSFMFPQSTAVFTLQKNR